MSLPRKRQSILFWIPAYAGMTDSEKMKKYNGFTLMELLIAVSIFAIITLCLYSTFSGGMQIWKRQEKSFKYSHSVRLALDNMAKELRNAINYSQPTHLVGGPGLLEEGQGLRFSGDEKKLTFMTIVGQEIARIDYIFETTPDKKGVLRRIIVFQDEGFKEENQKQGIFIEGLDNLTFEYAYKGEKEDSEPEWQKTWPKETTQEEPKIPIGVRITLTFQEPDRKEPEILKKTVFIAMGT